MYKHNNKNNQLKFITEMTQENEPKKTRKVGKTILKVVGLMAVAALGAALGNDKSRAKIFEVGKAAGNRIATGAKTVAGKVGQVFKKKTEVSNVPEIDNNVPQTNYVREGKPYRKYNN